MAVILIKKIFAIISIFLYKSNVISLCQFIKDSNNVLKIVIFYFSLIIFLLSGCISKRTENLIESLNKEITELRQKREEDRRKIAELEDNLFAVNSNIIENNKKLNKVMENLNIGNEDTKKFPFPNDRKRINLERINEEEEEEVRAEETSEENIIESLPKVGNLKKSRVKTILPPKIYFKEEEDKFENNDKVDKEERIETKTTSLEEHAMPTPLKIEEESETIFKSGMNYYNNKEYGLAIFKFLDLIKKDSNYPNLDKTYFFLADSYFNLKEFNQALIEFNKIIKNFPESSLIPETLYKIGVCSYELNDEAGASDAFFKLISRYPNSEPALKAKEEIKEIGNFKK